jgi:hypothetical protein
MGHVTFTQWLARRDEGFLAPDQPPRKGMGRTNPLPVTNARRERLYAKPVKPPKPFAPSVSGVREVVPQRLIPKPEPPR